MKYSQESLDELASRVSLKDYASRSVEFVRHSGDTYFAVCPFHHEKTASLAVNTKKNFFHCFGCGKSGNIYTWIQLIEGLSFVDAVERVASLTGTDLSQCIESESMNVYRELARLSAPERVNNTERKQLDFTRDYEDKYSDEVPEEWVAEGISPEVIKKYEIRIDKSSNRIVYPVYDKDLNLIGVKGRTRFANFKELKLMKYLNYYKIGQLDYFTGYKQAKDAIKESRSVIIVEGIKSAMKLYSWGYCNVVSAETSVINEKQVELLVKLCLKDIIIAFDKDVELSKIQGCTRMLRRYANIYVVLDRFGLLGEKESPCDRGLDIWKILYNGRMRL